MIAGLVTTLLVCLALFGISLHRPQWGVIAIAGLVPFNGLLLISPLSMSYWKEAAVLAVLCATPFARRTPPGLTVVAPWLLPLGVLVPFGVISALVTQGTQMFFPLKIAFFYILLAVIAVLFPFNRQDKDTLISVLFGAAVLSAFYGIWQQFIGPQALADMGYEWNEQIRSAGPLLRSFGTFNQPFPFGLFLMLVIILVTAASLAEPYRLRSRLFLLAFPVLGAAMLLSVVRASYVGVAVGLVVIGVVLYRRFLAWMVFGSVLTGLVVAAASMVFGNTVLSTLTSSSSLEERGDHWSVNIPLILTRPLGQGLGTTGSSAAKVAEGYNPAAPLYQPDSYYIKILLELGPIGLACYAAVVILMVVPLLRMVPLTGDPLERALLGGAVAATSAACVAALFSTYLEIFPLDVFFWLIPAVAGSTSMTIREQLTGRARGARPLNRRTHTTRSTTAAILDRNDSSEKSAANRASADAG